MAVTIMQMLAPTSAAVMSFCASQISPCVPSQASPRLGLTICANQDSMISYMALNARILRKEGI